MTRDKDVAPTELASVEPRSLHHGLAPSSFLVGAGPRARPRPGGHLPLQRAAPAPSVFHIIQGAFNNVQGVRQGLRPRFGAVLPERSDVRLAWSRQAREPPAGKEVREAGM